MNKTSVSQSDTATSFMPPAHGFLQRKCACGNHTMGGGQCAECAKNKRGLQQKLVIGSSNDPLEQEADRIADQVMTTPMHSHVNTIPPRIQRFTGHAASRVETVPASVDRILAGSGRPLDPALQHDMEQRLGYDFSHVRVHTGVAAEQSARDVSARAYTVGHNIVFGAKQYSPGSTEGQRLLAHELTHVIQQGRADSTIVFQENSGTEDSTLQHSRMITADKTDKITSRQARPKLNSDLVLQRATCPCCADSISIGNISRIDNATHMGHSFDVSLGLAYPASGPSGSCTLEWWEKTDVPAIPGHAPNTWTDMYSLYSVSPTFDPWKNRSESCGTSSPVTITDPPSLGKRPGRTVTRTLEFRIVINSMPATSEGGCAAASQQVTAKQILKMVNGVPDWAGSSFTTP